MSNSSICFGGYDLCLLGVCISVCIVYIIHIHMYIYIVYIYIICGNSGLPTVGSLGLILLDPSAKCSLYMQPVRCDPRRWIGTCGIHTGHNLKFKELSSGDDLHDTISIWLCKSQCACQTQDKLFVFITPFTDFAPSNRSISRSCGPG